MANGIKNIKRIFCLACGILYLMDIVYPQDKTFVIEKGTKTFTLSSTGDNFKWFLNGIPLSETSGTYTSTWLKGEYWLAILPYKGGCAGDTFSVKVKVLDTITSEGGQVMFTDSLIEVCPPSNAVPSSQEIIVQVKFYGYILQPGEKYRFSYSIDDEVPSTTDVTFDEIVILNIPTLDWSAGNHTIKITRLEYGANLENIVDYTTSQFIPLMQVNVKAIPSIGEIEY